MFPINIFIIKFIVAAAAPFAVNAKRSFKKDQFGVLDKAGSQKTVYCPSVYC